MFHEGIVTGTSGDTVHIGAGVYRETVTMDTSGNGSGNLIEYIADVTGEFIHFLAELAPAVVLFTDASRIDVPLL